NAVTRVCHNQREVARTYAADARRARVREVQRPRRAARVPDRPRRVHAPRDRRRAQLRAEARSGGTCGSGAAGGSTGTTGGGTGAVHAGDVHGIGLRRLASAWGHGSPGRKERRPDAAQRAGRAGRNARGEDRDGRQETLELYDARVGRDDVARHGIVGRQVTTQYMKATLALENGIWYEGEAAG